MNSAHRARLRTFHASSTTLPKCRVHLRRGFASSSIRRQAVEDHYKVMGLGPEATESQIKTRYYTLSKLYHPDLNPNAKDTHEKYLQLRTAFEILGKPQSRRDYDRKRAGINTNSSQRSHAHAPGSESAGGGSGIRAKRRTAAWTSTRQHPLEMGFAPRSTWHPEFRRFYDDWAAKMKEGGYDPEKTSLGYAGRTPNPALLQQMMNGDLLAQYMKKMRAEGKDPLSQVFMSATGRNSTAGQWLKNRMAMLDKEETARGGGVWERGGAKRRDTSAKGFSRSWGTGSKPAYSSEDPDYVSPAERLGGKGTGEETFNSPWDEPPRRGYQKEVPRPAWASGFQPGYDTWKPDIPSSATVKRDYSKGHELDARHEEDKIKMVQNERRWRGGMMLIGATSAVIAGWSALTTWF